MSKKKLDLIQVNEYNLARVIGWVPVVDAKAQFVLTIILAILGFFIAQSEDTIKVFLAVLGTGGAVWFIGLLLLLLAALVLLGVSIVYLILVIHPKRSPHTQEKSYFFYQTIADMPSSKFSEKMAEMDSKDIVEGLSEQTFNISKVVTKKFSQLSISIILFAIGLGVFLIYKIIEIVLLNTIITP